MAPMNNRLMVPRKTPGLLDLVPGAAAAYSLRSLSRSYAGPVVTVRRSSDDAEDSFTAAEVSDGTLAAFCGAGDGFVYRWWDQSGNANHAVAAADANEPQIVDSGVVILEEGKPAIQFDASDDYFVVPHASELNVQLQPSSFLLVAKQTAGFRVFQKGDGAGTLDAGHYFFYPLNGFGIATAFGNGGPADTSQALYFARWNATTSALFHNGAKVFFSSAQNGTVVDGEVAPNLTPTANTENLYIGRRNFPGGSSGQFGGTMQELVFWNTDVVSQRELIESQTAWSYSV